jgi:transposase
MPQSRTLSLGMDVHNDSRAVADLAQDHDAQVISLGTLGTRHGDLDTLIRTMQAKAKHLVFVSAAGPCGSWLSRSLTKQGSVCGVIAPSLMPNKAGDRVNTDRRDAVPLARLLRSGALTPVSVPHAEDEAIRDLSRAREEALGDLTAAQFRLTACLRRHDIRYPGRATWSSAHLRWLSEGAGPTPAQPMVFQADVRAVTEHTARLQGLDHGRHAQVNAWRLQPVVDALQALRGGPFTVAVTTVADLGDLTRFDTPESA